MHRFLGPILENIYMLELARGSALKLPIPLPKALLLSG